MGFDVRVGHVLDVLSKMPDKSVNCCVTSPPYYGLRSYGTPPQVWGGNEDCNHDWQDTSYRDSRKTDTTAGEKQRTNDGATGWRDGLRANETCSLCGAWSGDLGLEPTPQLFVSHIAMVFREVKRVLKPDGTLWLNLGDSFCSTDKWGGGKSGNTGKHTIDENGGVPSWAVRERKQASEGLKPKDLIGIPWRCAFALQEAGWWLRSDIIWAKPAPMPESVTDRPTRSHEYVFLLTKNQRYYYDHEAIKEPSVCGHPSGNGYKRDSRLTYADDNGARGSDKPWEPRPSIEKGGFGGKTEAMSDTGQNAFRAVTEMRNKRDVWTINSNPTPEAHFATYPIALAETCILAGCPAGGIVLDPFSGAGTTGLAAIKHGRNYIGIELNPEYAKITADRAGKHSPLFTQNEDF